MLTEYYLAADIQRAREMLEWGMVSQQGVSAAMDALWNDTLNSPLYTTLARLGSFFATGTIAIWTVMTVKDMVRDETGYPPYERFVWLFVACALLTFDGAMLRQVTFALRAILNTVNIEVLASTSGRIGDLASVYQQVSTMAGLQAWAATQQQNCLSIPDPARQSDCLNTLDAQIRQLSSVIQSNTGNNGGTFDLNPLNALGSSIEYAIQVWMFAIGIAFQWLVEVTWLLLGLAGPLAVGGMLLPVQQKSIFSWLIGFYSVGLCKLFYNVLVGLIAVLQLQTVGASNLIFAVAVGLLSPILAVAMAAGGGMATFLSIGTVAATALGAPLAGAGGAVAGRAAGFAGRQVVRATNAVSNAVRNARGSSGGNDSGVNPVPPPPTLALPGKRNSPRLSASPVPRAALPPSKDS